VRSKTQRALKMLGLSTFLALAACGTTATRPTLTLTSADRTPIADPALPNRVVIPPLAPTAEAERASLLEKVLKPLMDFSMAQEATKQLERERANGLVRKADAFNGASKPKRAILGFKLPF
jgi:hypothetical protein